MFYDCTSITANGEFCYISSNENLFNNSDVTNYYACFANCYQLTLDENLPNDWTVNY